MNEGFISGKPGPIKTHHIHIEQLKRKVKEKKVKRIQRIKHNYKETI